MANHARTRDIEPVYLIFGGEPFLIDEALDRLRARVAEKGDLDFNLEEIRADESPPERVIEVCETLPFMSEVRLVIVHNINSWNAAQQAVVAEYVPRSADHSVLVLVGEKVSRGSKLSRAVEARWQGRHGKTEARNIYEFKPLAAPKLPAWIKSRFAGQGKKATDEAVRYLVRHVSRSLGMLSQEIDKAALFAGLDTVVSLETVEQVISTSADTHVFDLCDAIGKRDLTNALRTLDLLLRENESPWTIFHLLLRHFRLLLKTKSLMELGIRGRDLAENLSAGGSKRLPDFVVNSYRNQAGNFSSAELKRALRLMRDADYAAKTSDRELRLVIEILVTEIVSGIEEVARERGGGA